MEKEKLLNCYSLYLDIGRGNWKTYTRTNEQYIAHFQNFWGKIEAKLTLFCEEYFVNEVLKAMDDFKKLNGFFKSEIKFEIIDRQELYYFQIIQKIREIQSSPNMKNYSKRDYSGPPEYTNAEWTAIMLSKPIILELAKKRNLIPKDCEVIAWADFGIAHCGHNKIYSDSLIGKKLIEPNEEKITFFNKRNHLPSSDPWVINNQQDDVYTPGGFYIVPVRLIEEFNEKFHHIVEEKFFKQSIIDDDQTIMAVFSAMYMEISRLEDSSKYINNPPEGDFFPVFYTTKNIIN